IAALAAAEPPLPRELANALAWRVRLALEQQPAEARAPVAQLAALTGDALVADAGWRMRAALLEAEMLLQQQDAASAGGSLQRAAQALADWDAPDPLEVAELDLLQAQHAWQAGQVGNAVRVLDQAAVRLAALRSPPARLLARERELRARLQGGAAQ